MRRNRLITTIALITSVCTTLSGCSVFVGENVEAYPLEASLTQQEVVDYYAKALDYDSIVSRNITEHKTTYEVQSIEGKKAEDLKLMTEKAEMILGMDTYEVTEENINIVSPDTYGYIKGVIDNEVLSDGTILDITGALGYYFVDKQYNLSRKTPGTFNYLTSLIGLDGAFYEHFDGSYSVDTYYLLAAVDSLNEYFYENNIVKCASYDSGTNIFQIVDGVKPNITKQLVSDINLSNLEYSDSELNVDEENNTEVVDDSENTEDEVMNLPEDETVDDSDNEESTIESNNDITEDVDSNNVETTDNTDTTDENTEDSVGDYTDNSEESNINASDALVVDDNTAYNSIVAADRKIQIDTTLVNSIVGSSLRQSASMPNLDYVYNIPDKEGDICGNGIYIAGGNGLKVFGFDREELAGTITLRYVFKDDSNGTGKLIGTNVFVLEEQITNGINIASNNVLIPEFLLTEFEKIIERADRVQVNCDLSGIMSGHLYEDMGFGVLRGYREKNTGIHKYMSTIRQVINRDTSNNSYLLEVETTTIEGAKDVDCYGTYKDKSYVVIQQQGNEFKIIDQIRVSRDCVVEPSINPDSTIQKRLVALNLASEIPQESKDAIVRLMSELYTAGTNRILRGPLDVDTENGVQTIEKGMYDCFQNDTAVLSSDKLEYMNSQLRNVLIRNGVEVSSIYRGTITEWIGGYDNQAEFTTEELVTYNGRGEAYYMQVYYLVSKLNDVWVIDERTILDEREVTDQGEIDNILSRVGGN